jgi:hypothetical protein
MTTSRPIFILTTARAGSTLLRFILDSHPDVACPPELNLSAAIGAIYFSSLAARGDDVENARADARALSIELAERSVGAYARQTGKRRWCEKSLPSPDQVDLLVEVFPDAQFICLYRECTDTAVSLVEASPWGYGAFGVEPYVRLYPMNIALALCLYWADRVQVIRAAEEAHPDRCLRVRYEDLVRSPRETVDGLCTFLEIPWSDSCLDAERVFRRRSSRGPGDLKIRYTKSIHQESVGRGWTLPVEVVPPDIRARVNGFAAELGYPPLEADIRESLALRGHDLGRTNGATPVDELFARAAERLAAGVPADGNGKGRTFKVVLADDPRPYLLDLATGRVDRSDETAACTVLTNSETLLGIASGATNPATAVRQSTLRLASSNGRPADLLLEDFDDLLAVLLPDELVPT